MEMISPNTYYKNSIEGKEEKEIKAELNKLLSEIKNLEKVLASADDKRKKFILMNGLDAPLYYNKKYLQFSLNQIIENHLEKLPNGAEFNINKYFEGLNLTEKQKFDFYDEFMKGHNNVKISNKHNGTCEGLPYNLAHIKN